MTNIHSQESNGSFAAEPAANPSLTRPAATLSTPREHLIRPPATFSPSNAEKGNPMGEGQVVEPFIGKQEVMQRLNKTLRTVDNWMKRGILPYYKIGRSVEFKWSEVEAHLAQTCRVCRRRG